MSAVENYPKDLNRLKTFSVVVHMRYFTCITIITTILFVWTVPAHACSVEEKDRFDISAADLEGLNEPNGVLATNYQAWRSQTSNEQADQTPPTVEGATLFEVMAVVPGLSEGSNLVRHQNPTLVTDFRRDAMATIFVASLFTLRRPIVRWLGSTGKSKDVRQQEEQGE